MDKRGPYGLACMACFKAKSKCVAQPDGEGCQRCHRLNKQCHPSESCRKRSSQSISSSQITQLESKVDRMLSLLESAAASVPQTLNQENKSVGPSFSEQSVFNSSLNLDPIYESPPLHSPPVRDSEETLVLFRREFLQHGPFLYLPPRLTAKELQQERPFLFECILCATARCIQERDAREREIKAKIVNATVMQNQPSIDLLLGTLTYILWGHAGFRTDITCVPRVMALAVATAQKLRLHEPVPENAHTPLELGGAAYIKKNEYPGGRSLEEVRAVLGCFLVSSVISLFYCETDTMRWTAQMDQYLSGIEASAECTDRVLAAHVRLQLLVEDARQARSRHEAHVPIQDFTRSFRSQLQIFRKSLPLELENEGEVAKDMIRMHIQYAELSIHETAYSAAYGIPATVSEGATTNIVLGPEAVECMYNSLLAIRSYFAVHSSLTPQWLEGTSIMTWSQFNRCQVTLYRLCIHPAADWDREAARNIVDLIRVQDIVRQKCKALSIDYSAEPHSDDKWVRTESIMETEIKWLSARLKPGGVKGSPNSGTAEPTTTAPTAPETEPQIAASHASHASPGIFASTAGAFWLRRWGLPPGTSTEGPSDQKRF